MLKHILITGGLCLFMAAGMAQAAPKEDPKIAQQKELMQKIFQENPELVLDVLKDHSEQLYELVQQGAEVKRRSLLLSQWESDMAIPKNIAENNRPALGEPKAPITLVSYSDLTCAYCQQASSTIKTLMEKYPGQIRFVFKSNPSGDMGRHASRWFYAVYKDDPAKAWKLHDLLFADQKGYAADPMVKIKEFAKEAGLDANHYEKFVYDNLADLDVKIDADIEEAKKLGFVGTPYFVMNNLVLRGALPLDNFVDAVEFINKNKK